MDLVAKRKEVSVPVTVYQWGDESAVYDLHMHYRRSSFFLESTQRL